MNDKFSPNENIESPLASAVWSFLEDASQKAEYPLDLALVIPDDNLFGSSMVNRGNTNLERLYGNFYRSRPSKLINRQVRLIWRSVATLYAALEQGFIKFREGKVLVININQQLNWKLMELRRWKHDSRHHDTIHITRLPSSNPDESKLNGSVSWMRHNKSQEKILSKTVDPKIFYKSTRWAEILAMDAPESSIIDLGVDPNAIEHRSVEVGYSTKEDWRLVPSTLMLNPGVTSLVLGEIGKVIESVVDELGEFPLAIVIENPIGEKISRWFTSLSERICSNVNIYHISGAETVKAASKLASILSDKNHHEAPAWLDTVPEIQVEVRDKDTSTNWHAIVAGNEVIPAGESYGSTLAKKRRVVLAPGIQHIHLHLRRGHGKPWESRYTRLPIEPSDYERVVEPIARVRPLTDFTRIELVEHMRDGSTQILAGPTTSFKWSDLETEQPTELRSIPELYVFQSNCKGWLALQAGLDAITKNNSTKNRHNLYKIESKQWRDKTFPLGSDGQPPLDCGDNYTQSQALLKAATDLLLSGLEKSIANEDELKLNVARKLHMGLTWLFTGCPERVTEILLDAVLFPDSKAGRTLHVEERYSAWAIYSGIGRTVKSDELLRLIFDDLIQRWENAGNKNQDKFLLAAVSHPLARRVNAHLILSEGKKRFDRVKNFLDQQLDNIIAGEFDTRPSGIQAYLELRYILMGYRGLCQIRYDNSDWFPVNGSEANSIFNKLIRLQKEKPFNFGKFEDRLLTKTAPYLIGEGKNPTMPSGF